MANSIFELQNPKLNSHKHIRIRTHIYTHIHIHTHIYIGLYRDTHTHTHTYIGLRRERDIYTYLETYVEYIYTQYLCIYIRVSLRSPIITYIYISLSLYVDL